MVDKTEFEIGLEKRLAVLEALVKDIDGKHGPTRTREAKRIHNKIAGHPSKYKYSVRSISRMVGVHPMLVKVFMRAIQISPYDFGITQGVRTDAEQAHYRATGASRVSVSFHQTKRNNTGFGHALDIVLFIGGKPNWDFPKYKKVAQAVEQAAKELDVKFLKPGETGEGILWGGEWPTLRDGPHFEIHTSRKTTW